jgi:hypothetical protein
MAWASSFWGPGGFEIAVSRVVSGKDTLKTFTAMVEARSKIENDYAAALEKLAKGHDKELAVATGTMATALLAFKGEIESEAASRRRYAVFLNENIAIPSTKWREEQQKPRKAAIAKGEKAAADLSAHTARMKKAEQKYREVSQKCEAACLANQQSPGNPKTEKAKATLLKDYSKAEQEYGDLIEKVQGLTVALQETYIECFNFFETKELERMNFMRDRMNDFARETAALGPSHENSTQAMASRFAEVRPNEDSDAFVTEKRTGNSRPEWFVFEPYQSQVEEQAPTRSYGQATCPAIAGGGPVSASSSAADLILLRCPHLVLARHAGSSSSA